MYTEDHWEKCSQALVSSSYHQGYYFAKLLGNKGQFIGSIISLFWKHIVEKSDEVAVYTTDLWVALALWMSDDTLIITESTESTSLIVWTWISWTWI